MFQDSSFSSDNLYQSSNSFDDIAAYIFSVFDHIESELVPLENEVYNLKFELKNYKKSFTEGSKEKPFNDNRNEFGFPLDETFSEEHRKKSFGSIHDELIVAEKEFVLELEKVKEKLLIIFSNERSELIEKINSIESPKHLLGLVNRAFKCVEEHFFGIPSLDTQSNMLMTLSEQCYFNPDLLFTHKKVLETFSADYFSITAKKGFETVGALLIEDRERDFEIKGLAVNFSLRRQGIGSSLVDQAINLAKSNNSSLSVVVPETNLESQLFFKKNDFVSLKIYENYFSGEVGGYFMSRNLD